MAILLAILSSLFASSKDLMSKTLASKVDGPTSTFASFAFALPYYILVLPVLLQIGQEQFTFSSQFLLLVIARSLSDCFAEGLKMKVLGMADISLIIPFLSLSPLFLVFFAPIIIGDSVTPLGGFGVALIVIGTIFSGKSVKLWPLGGNELKAIGLAILSAIFMALNSCFDKLAVHQASPVWSSFAVTIGACVFFLPRIFHLGSRTTQSLCLNHWRAFSLRGLFETLYMVTKLSALQLLSAPYVVSILKIHILFAIIGGRFIFKEEGFGHRIMAGLFIAGGLIAIVVGG